MTLFYSFPFTGLSPLARGTHFNPHLFLLLRRFIPAGAGNTGSTRPRRAAAPVYPRWRGEHRPEINSSQRFCGLSPLARGTPQTAVTARFFGRFIPAGAGNTASSGCALSEMPVYPRWRGEHMGGILWHLAKSGLSPLARGTRRKRHKPEGVSRFIPAGAGNTPVDIHTPTFLPVYPRWRGEHSLFLSKTLRIRGLSPLARGTH
ncbi:Domain of uncharacterised function (DUF2825) [Klebsiella pneumoniae]|nr:hypothetical protein P828_04515 [Klebsiella pneumoniae UCI 25]SVW85023.1 Domain of uncharacterised function (DUF2825) [Klebsiella pneumoniae]SWB12296.1 Domain of uncharacterised function (DUF2825) [Klebsiella pneumoniae]SWT16274.1 Domain of uncharacterised function (DUF2825) [Klebsiella pneumoniae]VVJ61479.1 Domain of uncharacterised function (DUF2825) [Klebsiella pneumoniae]